MRCHQRRLMDPGFTQPLGGVDGCGAGAGRFASVYGTNGNSLSATSDRAYTYEHWTSWLLGPIPRGSIESPCFPASPNTVEIGASHSLLLAWVDSRPQPQGGRDAHATRTMHPAAR